MREIYYVKPIDNSRLVPLADHRLSRRQGAILLVACGLFATALGSAWHRLGYVQAGYRLEALQREKQQMLEANRKLKLEEAALDDPVRIEMIARHELGMTTLSPHQIVRSEAASGSPAIPVLAQVRRAAGPLPSPARNVAAAVP